MWFCLTHLTSYSFCLIPNFLFPSDFLLMPDLILSHASDLFLLSHTQLPFPPRLSDEDIEKMVKDAETFAEEDKKLKEKVEARNELESFVYSLKNQVS